MKKVIFLTLFCLLTFVSCVSTPSTSSIQNEITKSMDMNKETSIKVARLWVAENFRSAKNVIDFYDESLNVLTGNGIVVNYEGILPTEFGFRFKIQINEKTATVTFSQFTAGTGHYPVTNGTIGRKWFYNRLDFLANDLFSYLYNF